MRSMIFLFLMIFSFGAGANTNGGGVFSTKPLLSDKIIVFKTGQTHDSVLFAEGKVSGGQWVIESRSVRDQDLRSKELLKRALEISADKGEWAPLF